MPITIRFKTTNSKFSVALFKLLFFMYFSFMRILFFTILVFSISILAQTSPNPNERCDAIPMCLQISTALGMQVFSINTKYESTEEKYPDPATRPSLEHTINISGIIDSVWDNDACVFEQQQKENCSFKVLYKGKNSADISNNQPIMFTKRISLKHFKTMPDGSPNMSTVIDSNYIYVPQNIDINISDSVYIEGYSAIVNNYCNNTCSYTPIAIVVANYTVFPTITSIKKKTQSSIPSRQKRNRDAIGKKQKNKRNTALKIIY